MSRRLGLLTLLVCTVFLVTACSVDYSGQYGGLSDAGIFVSMTLGKDGTVETNMLGIPVTGTYTVKNDQITVKLTTMGYSQSIKGRITKDTIEFSDATLKRGVTSVDISNVSSLLGGASQTKATATPTAKATAKPTQAPENKAEIRFDEAERLFAIGHYDEAIAIYDEIASEMDVEDRRAYAIECKDIRDLYFEWHYNTRDSSVISNGLVLDKYTGYGMDEIVIPYGTCGMTSSAFRDNNEEIMSIILPDTISTIPAGCFSGCPNLRNINIPASITSFALNGTGITEFTVPSTVKTLPAGAFKDCTKLNTVVFEGQPLLSDGEDMFSGCVSLESVTIPASFGKIPPFMFYGCSSLRSVVIEDGIQSVGRRAFANCTSLESISFPESVTSFGENVFYCCTSLKEIAWPSKATTIPRYTFEYCSALRSVTLPDTLTSIEDYAFQNCTSLYEITLPKMIKSISAKAFDLNWREVERLTLSVTKGTFGHRYAEEQGYSYIFTGTVADRVPLGYEFTLGSYGGQPLTWVVIAHYGDKEMALCSQSVATMAYNDAGGDPTYEESTICSWLENEFSVSAFGETDHQTSAIPAVQLLPYSYYERYVKATDHTHAPWWLKDKHSWEEGKAVCGYSYGVTNCSERVETQQIVRPICILTLNSSGN